MKSCCFNPSRLNVDRKVDETIMSKYEEWIEADHTSKPTSEERDGEN